MAFDPKNLVVDNCGPTYTSSGGAAGGTNRAMYEADLITDDAPTVVETPGYFTGIYNGVQNATRLPLGTMIEAVMSASTVPVFKNYVVSINDGVNVTITLQKTIAG